VGVLRFNPSDRALALDYAECARITRRASSNFYYAFMLLPADRRRSLYAVYAFCRFIDNISDDAGIKEPAAMLARWRRELDAIYQGRPNGAVSRALANTVARFEIPRRHLDDIIDGVEMDLALRRYSTFEELCLYCYRVASAVGLACIRVFGCRNPQTESYAENLGIALQMTNILRDVREDAARDRIYLPTEDLKRFGVREEDILLCTYSEGFRRLMEFEARRAQAFYDAAKLSLPADDRAALLSAEAMRLIYHALLDRIVSVDYRVFDHRCHISTTKKLYLVGRAWASGHFGFAAG
jgi:phytoene synthase